MQWLHPVFLIKWLTSTNLLRNLKWPNSPLVSDLEWKETHFITSLIMIGWCVFQISTRVRPDGCLVANTKDKILDYNDIQFRPLMFLDTLLRNLEGLPRYK